MSKQAIIASAVIAKMHPKTSSCPVSALVISEGRQVFLPTDPAQLF